MKKYLLLTYLITFLFPYHVLAQDAGKTMSLDYDLYVQGYDIGDINIRISEKNGQRTVIETSLIQYFDSGEQVTIRGSNVEEYQNGKLIRIDNKINMNNDAYWIRVESHNDSFLAYVKEIKNLTTGESDNFAKIITATQKVEGGEEVQVSNIMSIASSLLAGHSKGLKNIQIPVDNFDTTSTNLLSYMDHLNYKFNSAPVSVFDSEELQSKKFVLKYMGDESIQVSEHPVSAKHIQQTPVETSGKPSHIWINTEEIYPYIVKFTGEDEEGPNELRLKNKVLY